MVTIERSAYGTHTDVLTTELNSLANNSTAITAAIDNTSNHFIYIDVELEVTFGSAPTLNAGLNLYVVPSQDGTNYADGSAGTPGTIPAPHCLRGVFLVRAVTSAQRIILERIEVPPGLYKLLLENKAGQTTAASGNVLAYRGHELSSA
jgi:hypothetical protein